MRVLFTLLSVSLATTAAAKPPYIPDQTPTKPKETNTEATSYRKIANDQKRPAKEREEALRWLIKNQLTTQYWAYTEDPTSTKKTLLADYQALLLLCPDDGKLHYDYAVFAESTLASTIALNAYARALRLGYKPAASQLGKIYFRRQDYETALTYLELASDFEPARAESWLSLGRTQYLLSDYEGAARSFDKAFAVNVKLSDKGTFELYCQALVRAERYADAIAVTKQMLSYTYFNDFETYLIIASVYSSANQPENAIFYYTRALEASSNLSDKAQARVMNNYAWFFCTTQSEEYKTPEFLLKAFRMSTKSVDITKQREPMYLDTLAEIYFLLGYPEKALELEQNALSLNPSYEFYHEQIEKFEAALEEPTAKKIDPALLFPVAEELTPTSTPTRPY